jgi:hypothetical protein
MLAALQEPCSVMRGLSSEHEEASSQEGEERQKPNHTNVTFESERYHPPLLRLLKSTFPSERE